MSQGKRHRGIALGYVVIAVLGIMITGMSLSVWAKPYTYAKDTTKLVVVTDKTQAVLATTKQVDTLAINTSFLQRMREKGELLSSEEFASRITDYYNTLVAVLTALFVLFTLVTYITFKTKFEAKFEDKARDLEDKQRQLEDKQRQKIVDELRSMLSDSKSIDEVIQTAIGGRIDDSIAKKEEVDDLSINVESNQKNIVAVSSIVDDIKKKQQELFKVVADLQDQVASGTTIHQEEKSTQATQTETFEAPTEQE